MTAPRGWKLVPVAPTREMIDAAMVAIKGDVTALYRGTDDSIESFFRAMLNAAPRRKGEG